MTTKWIKLGLPFLPEYSKKESTVFLTTFYEWALYSSIYTEYKRRLDYLRPLLIPFPLHRPQTAPIVRRDDLRVFKPKLIHIVLSLVENRQPKIINSESPGVIVIVIAIHIKPHNANQSINQWASQSINRRHRNSNPNRPPSYRHPIKLAFSRSPPPQSVSQ